MRKVISLDFLLYKDDQVLLDIIQQWIEIWQYYQEITSVNKLLEITDKAQLQKLTEGIDLLERRIIQGFNDGLRLSLATTIKIMNKNKDNIYYPDNRISLLMKNYFILYYLYSAIDRDFLIKLHPIIAENIDDLLPGNIKDFSQVTLIDDSWQIVLQEYGVWPDDLALIDHEITKKITPALNELRLVAVNDFINNGNKQTVFSSLIDFLIQQQLWLPEYSEGDVNSQLFILIDKFSTEYGKLLLYGSPFLKSKEYLTYAVFRDEVQSDIIDYETYVHRQYNVWNFFRSFFSFIVSENISLESTGFWKLSNFLHQVDDSASPDFELSKLFSGIDSKDLFWNNPIKAAVEFKRVIK